MIDPNIALSVKPVAIPDVAKQFAESEGLAQQRALRNLQIQEGTQNLQRLQRSNEEQALEQQDQLKLRQVYQDANGDPEKTVQGAISAGVSPKSVQGLQQHFADYAQKIAKTKADELPVIKDRDERMLALHDQALQLATDNPEQYAAQYPQIYAAAVRIDPEAAKHLDPNTPPTVDQLKLSQLGYLTHTSFLSQEEEKRKQAAENQASIMRPLQVQELQGKIAEQDRTAADKQKSEDATMLAAAAKQGPDALAAGLQKLSQEGRVQPFMGVTSKTKPEEILAIATNPEQQITAGQTAAHNAATEAHNKVLETIAKGHLAVSQADLALKTKQNEQEYGKGTAEFWAHQLADNPDSIKELPAKMHTAVGEKFKELTGLPLPTPLTGTVAQSETASRSALDNIDFIREALKNPEIKQRIGPILGRLGNAEQAAGSAIGLSPQAEQLAQELRTRMRYFVFQEGKSLLGGRLPTQLVKELETSSAKPSMDANTLLGALKGAEGSAMSTMDNADKQRFGGKMRSREQRGMGNRGSSQTAPQKGDKRDYQGHTFEFDGTEWVRQ